MHGAREVRGAATLPIGLTLLLAACASPAPRPVPPVQTGEEIAGIAAALVGSPYHFGGADAAGFDCSGLALYAHQRVGLSIPRTAREQQAAARPVPLDALAPGDLVFFRIHSRHVNHVGIYAGAGRFIHAPRAGVAVTYGDLSQGYYRKRLVAAGRFWDTAPEGAAAR